MHFIDGLAAATVTAAAIVGVCWLWAQLIPVFGLEPLIYGTVIAAAILWVSVRAHTDGRS